MSFDDLKHMNPGPFSEPNALPATDYIDVAGVNLSAVPARVHLGGTVILTAPLSQPLDAGLTSLSTLPTVADRIAYSTALDTWAETPLTSFARTLIDDADALTARATLGVTIGTDVQAYDASLTSLAALATAADKIPYTTGIDTYAETALSSFARTLIDDADALTARATLGVTIGTDVQAYDASLTSLAALATAADKIPYTTGVDTYAETGITALGRLNINLSSLTNHGVLIGQGSSAMVATAAGTANQMLVSGGALADPTWTSNTYPVTANQGDIHYASAANTITALAKDTNSTRYLSNTGASNNPAWAQVNAANGITGVLPASSGGNWILISTQTASNSANLIFTDIGSYSFYAVVIRNILPATNATDLEVLVSSNNGSSYAASGYIGGVNYSAYNSATVTNGNATTYGMIAKSQSSGVGISATLFFTPGNGQYQGTISFYNTTIATSTIGICGGGTGVVFNALKFLMSSGNITSGTISLYGIQIA